MRASLNEPTKPAEQSRTMSAAQRVYPCGAIQPVGCGVVGGVALPIGRLGSTSENNHSAAGGGIWPTIPIATYLLKPKADACQAVLQLIEAAEA